jgi:hypothetical protein
LLGYVEKIFDLPFPKRDRIVGCTDEHLSACPECQEVKSTFGKTRWKELADRGVPIGVAGFNFLSPAAQRYFFAAYLYTALRDKDDWPLDTPVNRLPPQTAGWRPDRRELILLALRLLDPESPFLS